MNIDDMPDLSPEEHEQFNRRAAELENQLGDTIVRGPHGDRKVISEAGFEKILGMVRSYPNIVVVGDRSSLEGSVMPLPPKRENPIELINPMALEKSEVSVPKSAMAAQAEAWQTDVGKVLHEGIPVGQMHVLVAGGSVNMTQCIGRVAAARLRAQDCINIPTQLDVTMPLTYCGISRQKQRELKMFSADFDGDMIIGNGIRRVIVGLLRSKTKKGPKRKFATKHPYTTHLAGNKTTRFRYTVDYNSIITLHEADDESNK